MVEFRENVPREGCPERLVSRSIGLRLYNKSSVNIAEYCVCDTWYAMTTCAMQPFMFHVVDLKIH